MKNKVIKKIVIDAILLAMFCIIGMFSISLGENMKISFQLLFVFIIALLNILNVFDCLIITICYLLIGLVLPIYAGFNVGITPTFGYVIGFIFTAAIIKLLNNLFINKMKLPIFICGLISSLIGLLFTYIIGTLFFSLYMNFNGGFWNLLLVTVIPYIAFDILKIIIACLISIRLNKIFNQLEENK